MLHTVLPSVLLLELGHSGGRTSAIPGLLVSGCQEGVETTLLVATLHMARKNPPLLILPLS